MTHHTRHTSLLNTTQLLQTRLITQRTRRSRTRILHLTPRNLRFNMLQHRATTANSISRRSKLTTRIHRQRQHTIRNNRHRIIRTKRKRSLAVSRQINKDVSGQHRATVGTPRSATALSNLSSAASFSEKLRTAFAAQGLTTHHHPTTHKATNINTSNIRHKRPHYLSHQ